MGMAKPTPLLEPDPDRIAVLMPTNSPRLLRRGPPAVQRVEWVRGHVGWVSF
jgi:hypothetical protein